MTAPGEKTRARVTSAKTPNVRQAVTSRQVASGSDASIWRTISRAIAVPARSGDGDGSPGASRDDERADDEEEE